MLKEFKKFILRGNVMDLAIGIIIGGAFGKIVTSLVNDIIMPPIGLVLGKSQFCQPVHLASAEKYANLADAQAAGAATSITASSSITSSILSSLPSSSSSSSGDESSHPKKPGPRCRPPVNALIAAHQFPSKPVAARTALRS